MRHVSTPHSTYIDGVIDMAARFPYCTVMIVTWYCACVTDNTDLLVTFAFLNTNYYELFCFC